MNFFSYFSNGCNLKQKKNGVFDFPLSYMAFSNLLSFSICASDVHDLQRNVTDRKQRDKVHSL